MFWKRYTYSCRDCRAEYTVRGRGAAAAFILGSGRRCPECGEVMSSVPLLTRPPCPPPKPEVKVVPINAKGADEKENCVTGCHMCKAKDVLNMFTWGGSGFNPFMGYNKEAKEILLDEQAPLRAIMIANPVQRPRTVRLVTAEALKEFRRTPRQKNRVSFW